MGLETLQLLLGLRSLPVSSTELDLHLIEVSLHLLLQPEGMDATMNE